MGQAMCHFTPCRFKKNKKSGKRRKFEVLLSWKNFLDFMNALPRVDATVSVVNLVFLLLIKS